MFVIDRNGVLRYQGAFDDVTFRKRIPIGELSRSGDQCSLSGGTPDPEATPPYGCAIVRFFLDTLKFQFAPGPELFREQAVVNEGVGRCWHPGFQSQSYDCPVWEPSSEGRPSRISRCIEASVPSGSPSITASTLSAISFIKLNLAAPGNRNDLQQDLLHHLASLRQVARDPYRRSRYCPYPADAGDENKFFPHRCLDIAGISDLNPSFFKGSPQPCGPVARQVVQLTKGNLGLDACMPDISGTCQLAGNPA
jgi:hypothetical protein